jgi:hypothetical protein
MLEAGGVAQLAQPPEVGPRRLGVRDLRRNGHEPADLEMREAAELVQQRLHLAGRRAALLRLVAEVHLEQPAHLPPRGVRAPVQLPRQLQAIDRVDPVEQHDGIPRLVGLQ